MVRVPGLRIKGSRMVKGSEAYGFRVESGDGKRNMRGL